MIAPIGPQHFASVAQIWARELPEDFCSELGVDFLREVYLPFFARIPDSSGFVELGEGDLPVGFVLAAPAQGFLVRLARENFFPLLSAVLKRILRGPRFCLYLAEILVLVPYQPKLPKADKVHELLYIAVARDAQNGAVGSRLTQCLLEHLRGIGCGGVEVKTLQKTSGTNRFYLRNGFELADSLLGRNWYFHRLGQGGGR
jgi:GNAT superfamily N-acetyltransferase